MYDDEEKYLFSFFIWNLIGFDFEIVNELSYHAIV
jgi:hypothetical protein